jgi:flagellar biosynthesis repressor protein FlbT
VKGTIQITLRAGERIYVNGAVLRVDRRVTLEFLNDVTFLLEAHVLHAEEATTPLRQLYFVLQTLLIDPSSVARTRKMFETSQARLRTATANEQITVGLRSVDELVASNRIFDALKALRALFPIEDAILAKADPAAPGNPKLEVA